MKGGDKVLKNMLKKINWMVVAQLVIALVLVFAPASDAFAQLNRGFQCPAGSGLNCNAGTDVNSFIRTVINWILGVTFGIAVLFLIIGGFWYITSAGNEETASKGKSTVINAIIGIIIIVLSYVIVSVISNLVATGGGGATAP